MNDIISFEINMKLPYLVLNISKNVTCYLLALMEMASPDLEKQGFFAVVFVNRQYNG